MIFDNELRHLGVLIAKKGRQEAFDEIKKLLKNEELADNTASNCNDSEHDDRWCSTCIPPVNPLVSSASKSSALALGFFFGIGRRISSVEQRNFEL